MSDPRGATDTDSGVVGQLRLPDWLREPVERAWREMPPLVRLFLGLAVVDLLGRSIGLLAPRIDFANTTLLGLLGSVVPRDLWIVLPALLVLRRPDAARATPWIFRGAIVLAITEFVTQPVVGLVGYASPGQATVSYLISFAASGARLVAWLLMALGLAELNPRAPSPGAAALSNVVATAVGVSIVIGLVGVLTTSTPDLGFFDPGLRQVIVLSGLASNLELAGWAYFLWVVTRSLGDERRPVPATTLAAAGAILAGLLTVLVEVLYRIVGAASPATVANPSGFIEVVNILGWIGVAVGPTLIVVAFALGLAEPAFPYVPSAAAAPLEPEPTEAPPPEAAPFASGAPAAEEGPSTSGAEAPDDAADGPSPEGSATA